MQTQGQCGSGGKEIPRVSSLRSLDETEDEVRDAYGEDEAVVSNPRGSGPPPHPWASRVASPPHPKSSPRPGAPHPKSSPPKVNVSPAPGSAIKLPFFHKRKNLL